MRQCLDEGLLQSYFDGELSTELMESATSHLASCATCASAARELEEETLLLTSAFAAEFDESVPTERLRERIDAAVLGMRVANAAAAQNTVGAAGFFNSLFRLFNFGSHRSLGYASLVVVLAFAAILGVVRLNTQNIQTVTTPSRETVATPSQQVADAIINPQSLPPASMPAGRSTTSPVTAPGNGVTLRPVKYEARQARPKAAPVKLIPGERTYLQTIAKLDTTIKSDKQAMRPALQVEYERNLAVVDRAIAATRSAVKSNPNDPDAADFMFAAYQSKVDLLNTIADARVGGH